VAQNGENLTGGRLDGRAIVNELLRNLEQGKFEMAFSVLLPCVFSIYLHPDDHARLAGVFPHITEDAKRALAARVSQMNQRSVIMGLKRRPPKNYRIAAQDWIIQFFKDTEGAVPPGDIEIHSELSEAPQPGFEGTKTTLIGREPSVAGARCTTAPKEGTRPRDRVYADIRYEDDSGPQVFLVTQNQVRVGRGGEDEPMDLPLYAADEVSREHMVLRRDPATGQFFILDRSTNGTWVNGRRLKRDLEQALPEQAEIGVAEVLTLLFQVRP
jgi:hypothetical protein